MASRAAAVALVVLTGVGAANWASASVGTSVTESAALTASDAAGDDNLGWAVAASGTTVVAGAPGPASSPGAVYVFEQPPGGWGGKPHEVAKLTASDSGGRLGSAVAVDGTTVVAGAPDAAAVYVFVRPPGGWSGTLHEIARLTATNQNAASDFGQAVAIAGTTVVVGAPASATHGVAFVYEQPQGGWSGALTETATLAASDPATGDRLAQSVAISGADVVAAAPAKAVAGNAEQGKAYVFTRPPGGWSATTTESAQLRASDGAPNDDFGEPWGGGPTVAIDGETVAVGSWSRSIDGAPGLVYAFNRPSAGWTGNLTEGATLIADGSDAGGDAGRNSLGGSVAVSGATVLAGAPTAPSFAGGAAYAFTRAGGSWSGVLRETGVLSASDGASGDYLGASVALAGSTGIAGALMGSKNFTGAAYVFAVPNGASTPTPTPTPAGSVTPAPTPTPDPLAGCPEKEVSYGVIVARGCFTRHGQVYVASGKVRVNGLDFEPSDGGHVEIDRAKKKLDASGNGVVKIGGEIPIHFWRTALHLDLGTTLTLKADANRAKLFGFPITGDVELKFTAAAVSAKVKISLEVLGDEVIAGATVTASNDRGLSLDAIDAYVGAASADPGHNAGEFCAIAKPAPSGFECVTVISESGTPYARLHSRDPGIVRFGGKLPVEDVHLTWKRATGVWTGDGTLSLGSFVPGVHGTVPTLTLGAGIKVNPFEFEYGRAQVDGLNVTLGPVFLQRISFKLQLHPEFAVNGGAGLSVGPAVNGKRAIGMDADFKLTRGSRDGVDLRLDGALSIVEFQVAGGYLEYDGRDGGSRVDFGGQVGAGYGPVSAQLALQGSVNADHLQALGNASLSAFGQDIGGRGVISDHGIGACGELHAFVFSGEVGFKHLWSGGTDFDGCDFSGLYTFGPGATMAARAAAVAVAVAQKEYAAVGAGGPPAVTLVAPDGRRVASPAIPDRIEITGSVLSVAVTSSKTTYFIAQGAGAGAWRIEPQPGATPPASLLQADPLHPTDLHARVTGAPRRPVLHWRLAPQRGETVTFVEQGPATDRALTAAVTSSGRKRFQPGAGPGGKRTILALVTERGLLSRRLVVATYRAPVPRRPRASRARFRVAGQRVTVTWRGPRTRAGSFEVDATLGSGRLRYRAPGRATSVRFSLPAGQRLLRITVTASARDLVGPAVRARRLAK
jgi:hypothetical protein